MQYIGVFCLVVYVLAVVGNWNDETHGKGIAIFGFAPLVVLGLICLAS